MSEDTTEVTEETKKSYMHMTNEELTELMKKLDMDSALFENENGSLNRKLINYTLKLVDVQIGKTKENMVINDEDGTIEEYKPTGPKLHKGLSGMMVEITFYNADENDLAYVQMGLNGIALIVQREQKTWIPKEFLDGVLHNAIMTKMKMDVGRDGKIRYIPKPVPRVPHTVYDIKHIDVLRDEYDVAQKKKNK